MYWDYYNKEESDTSRVTCDFCRATVDRRESQKLGNFTLCYQCVDRIVSKLLEQEEKNNNK